MSEAAVARANAKQAPDTYRCVQCGSRFLTPSGLAFHNETAHKRRPAPTRTIVSAADKAVDVVSIPPRSSGISGRLLAACAAQGNACHWCGGPFRFDQGTSHPLSPTREHAKPKSLGGVAILGIVHQRCNHIRGIIDQAAFRRLMDGEAVTREECWPHLFRPSDTKP